MNSLKLTFFTILLFCSVLINAQEELEVLDFDQFTSSYLENIDQPVVVNFWATWCKPCIEELPLFIKNEAQLKGEVNFLYPSLDFTADKAEHFYLTKMPDQKVIFLDDPDSNRWIPLVHEEWSGAIPFTIIITPSGDKIYHAGAFKDFNELKRFINQVL